MRSLIFLYVVLANVGSATGQPPAAIPGQEREVFLRALKIWNDRIASNPKEWEYYRGRAQVYESLGMPAEAYADHSRSAELAPASEQANIYFVRGCLEFRRGRIVSSIADFDKQIELNPKAKISHWQRGISYYYAGRWDDGIAQFEGYQTYDSNDVENAVWRFMCMTRKDGIDKARKEILKIGDDKRVPMRQVYDLYAGKLKVDDVLAAAKAGQPSMEQLNRQLFYAHLYVGIYYELEGNKKLALKHLQKAAEEHRIGHYMWDVARVHRDLLRAEMEKTKKEEKD